MPAYPLVPFVEWRFWSVVFGADSVIVDGSHILSAPEWNAGAELRWNGGVIAEVFGDMTLRLAPDAELFAAISNLVSGGGEVRIRVDRRPTRDGEPHTVWSGVFESIESDGTDAVVRARLEMPGRNRCMCRDLSTLPGYDAFSPNTFIPQVFGECPRVPAILLRAPGGRSRLNGPLAFDATTVQLRESVDWPAPGAAQVNDEVVFFDVIVGGTQLGSEAFPVSRFTRKDHADRAEVWRLDADGISWLVCDHESEVLDIRAGDIGESESVPGLTDSTAELDGRDATFLHGLILPVERNEAAFPTKRDALFGYEGVWQTTGDSNALRAEYGFRDTTDTGGAIVALSSPRLEAEWIGDLSRMLWRHDRIERALLAFEFSPYQGWTPETRLRVTIERDGAEVEALLSLEGFVEDLDEEFRITRTIEPIERAQIVAFDWCDYTAGWSNAEGAIDGLIVSSLASCTAGGGDEQLDLAFRRQWPSATGLARELRLRIRATSSTMSTITLRILGGALDVSESFGATDESAEYELSVPIEFDIESRELLAAITASIIVPSGGALDVCEAWLVLVEREGSAEPVAEALAAPIPTQSIEVDITELLADGFDWGAFTGATPRFLVRFEIEEANPISPAVLSRIHWRFETWPASSVKPTTRIFARVAGRHTGEDGAAAPGDVVRTLLESDDFAASPISDADEELWSDAEEALAERGVRYRACIADSREVDDALRAACGETGLILSPSAGRLVPVVLPISPEAGEATALEAARVEDALGKVTISASAPLAAPIAVLQAAITAGLTWRADESNAQATARARWADAGAEVTLRIANRWLTRSKSRVERGIHPIEGEPFIGTRVALANAATGRIAAIGRTARGANMTLDPAGGPILLWNAGAWSIVHSRARRAVLFLHAGIAAAELDAGGNLRLAGGVTVDGVLEAEDTALKVDESGRLLLSATEGHTSSAAALGADGSLILRHEITEQASIGAGSDSVLDIVGIILRIAPGASQTAFEFGPGGLLVAGKVTSSAIIR